MEKIVQEGAAGQLRQPAAQAQRPRDDEGVIRYGHRMVGQRSVVVVEPAKASVLRRLDQRAGQAGEFAVAVEQPRRLWRSGVGLTCGNACLR